MLQLYSLSLVIVGIFWMFKTDNKPLFFGGFALFVLGCFFRSIS